MKQKTIVVRLTIQEARFVRNEMSSAIACGATDPLFKLVASKIIGRLDKHARLEAARASLSQKDKT